jgi:hypothetical protein
LQWLTAAVAVLGAVLYLVLRVVASQFYTPLGLTVDDVGLGQLSMLVRAAFGVLLVVAAYGAIWLALIGGIVFAFVAELGESMASKNYARWLPRVAAAFGVTAAALLVGYWLLATGGDVRFLFGAILSGCAVTWLIGVWAGSILQAYPRVLFAWAALSLVMLLSAGFFQNLANIAGDDAQAVLSGHAHATGGVPLMPYRTQIAYVALGSSSTSAKQRCVVYLGEDGRNVVVYDRTDPTARRVRLLPADTEVAIAPGATTCPRKRSAAGRS